MKHRMRSLMSYLLLLSLFAAGISCSTLRQVSTSVFSKNLSLDYNSFPRKIQIPPPSEEQKKIFDRKALAERVTVTKENGKVLTGYVTDNKAFLEQVITPLILPHLEELKKQDQVEIINTLALFSHEIYSIYFGRDSFRWAGDILDLDDPQEEGIRYQYRYGMDCSGFAAMPYELAVHFGLMKPDEEGAVFCSKGYESYCRRHGIQDTGGRDGTSNHYRVDSFEMMKLGRLIFSVKQNGSPTAAQIKQLQPGDIVGLPGHAGIIVKINGEPYYLEFGGWVVPLRGGNPYPAGEAIRIFARRGEIYVRRSLPEPLLSQP